MPPTKQDTKAGTLRIWHIVNVPGKAFRQEVQSVEEAKSFLNLLINYDNYLGDSLIASNVSGLEVYEDAQDLDEPGWYEWHHPETDDDILDIIKAEWEEQLAKLKAVGT